MPEANEYQTIEIEENNLKIFLKIPLSTEDDLDAKTDINNIMIHTLQEQLSGI